MSFYKQPLLHFILAGAFLFWMYDRVSRPGEKAGGASVSTVEVDQARLQLFAQHQGSNTTGIDVSALDDQALQALARDYVREEVLYREALALGLDREDYTIRLRLAEKMQFILDNAAAADAEFSEQGLQAFYAERKQDYRVAAVYDFSHIFFDSRTRGEAGAQKAAVALLESGVLSGVTAAEVEKYGDRFHFLQDYGDRTRDFVVNNFSESFVVVLDSTEPSAGWFGPVASPAGFHLVQLRSRQESFLPSLDAVRPRVEEDYMYESIRLGSADALEALVSRYEVKVNL